MSTTSSDANHNSLFSEDDYDFSKVLPERKRQNYFIAILPLLIVLVIAGVILVISLIVYPNLREDIDTDSQEGFFLSNFSKTTNYFKGIYSKVNRFNILFSNF
jgi:hypothetical protein